MKIFIYKNTMVWSFPSRLLNYIFRIPSPSELKQTAKAKVYLKASMAEFIKPRKPVSAPDTGRADKTGPWGTLGEARGIKCARERYTTQETIDKKSKKVGKKLNRVGLSSSPTHMPLVPEEKRTWICVSLSFL